VTEPDQNILTLYNWAPLSTLNGLSCLPYALLCLRNNYPTILRLELVPVLHSLLPLEIQPYSGGRQYPANQLRSDQVLSSGDGISVRLGVSVAPNCRLGFLNNLFARPIIEPQIEDHSPEYFFIHPSSIEDLRLKPEIPDIEALVTMYTTLFLVLITEAHLIGGVVCSDGLTSYDIGHTYPEEDIVFLIASWAEHDLLNSMFPKHFFSVFSPDERQTIYKFIVASTNDPMAGQTFCEAVNLLAGDSVELNINLLQPFSADLRNPEVRPGFNFVINNRGVIHEASIQAILHISNLAVTIADTLRMRFNLLCRLLLPANFPCSCQEK